MLVHGSVTNGADDLGRSAAARRSLSSSSSSNRPGFPPGPPVERVDFEMRRRVGCERGSSRGDHLCGHSYGGVIALLAAARFRGRLADRDRAAGLVGRARRARVDAFARGAIELWREMARATPRPSSACSCGRWAPHSTLLPRSRRELEQGARTPDGRARAPGRPRSRSPSCVRLPFPKLVVSGAHHPAFDAICDVLERELDAERAVLPGAGHAVQRAPASTSACPSSSSAPSSQVTECYLAWSADGSSSSFRRSPVGRPRAAISPRTCPAEGSAYRPRSVDREPIRRTRS